MSATVPFQFPTTGHLVRTVTISGLPWFVVADVCAVLGISNPSMATSRLRADDLSTAEVIDSLGRSQQARVANESGLYDLLLDSRKPEARAFRHWITAEVVPAIRQTGSYSTAGRLPDINTPAGVLAMAEQFTATARALVAADEKIREMEPKALGYDTFLSADKGDRLVRETAKLLGWKERDLRAFLLEEKLIFHKQALCGQRQYDVYAAHIQHFKPVEKVVEHTWGSCSHYTLYVRPAGLDLIQRRIERQRLSIQTSIEASA